MDTTQILTFILGAIVPIFTLALKWGLDFITSERQYTKEREKVVLQHQIEATESAMIGYMEMWESLYSLKSVLEKFPTHPTNAHFEMLQRAENGVNRFQEKTFGSMKAIQLFYDFSSIAEEYKNVETEKTILELSDVISRTFERISSQRARGESEEIILVELEHLANSYHLYAQAIDCKMKCIQAIQEFLRKEFQKLK